MRPALRASAPPVVVGLVGALSLAIVPARPAAQVPDVETVLARAADYVALFIRAFSNVVTEEHYVQHVATGGSSGVLRRGGQRDGQRDIRSDLLLVHAGGLVEWRPFRDVFEVNGTAVRNRDGRLAELFSRPGNDVLTQAEAIAAESSRYNIGIERTVNTPVHTLLFLRASLQPRFRFTLDRQDVTAGTGVWIVKYEEHARPTLIRGERDTDLPASGRFWIDAGSGCVLRSELVTFSGNGTAHLTTRFRVEPTMGIALPIEMHENYQLQRGRVTATATYSRFRHFAVTTDATVAPANH
jgi:hypothetical protein